MYTQVSSIVVKSWQVIKDTHKLALIPKDIKVDEEKSRRAIMCSNVHHTPEDIILTLGNVMVKVAHFEPF